jgi:hypothetical protein
MYGEEADMGAVGHGGIKIMIEECGVAKGSCEYSPEEVFKRALYMYKPSMMVGLVWALCIADKYR